MILNILGIFCEVKIVYQTKTMTIRIEKTDEASCSSINTDSSSTTLTSLPPRIPRSSSHPRKIRSSSSGHLRQFPLRNSVSFNEKIKAASFSSSDCSDSCSDNENHELRSPLSTVVLDSTRQSKIRKTNSLTGKSFENHVTIHDLIKYSKSLESIPTSTDNSPRARSSLVMGTQILSFKNYIKENNIEKAERMMVENDTCEPDIKLLEKNQNANFTKSVMNQVNTETYDNVPEVKVEIIDDKSPHQKQFECKSSLKNTNNTNKAMPRKVSFSSSPVMGIRQKSNNSRPRVRLSYVETIPQPELENKDKSLNTKRRSWAAGEKQNSGQEINTKSINENRRPSSYIKLSRSKPVTQSMKIRNVIRQPFIRSLRSQSGFKRLSWSPNHSQNSSDSKYPDAQKKFKRFSVAGTEIHDDTIGQKIEKRSVCISSPISNSFHHVNAFTRIDDLRNHPDVICHTHIELKQRPDLAALLNPIKRFVLYFIFV